VLSIVVIVPLSRLENAVSTVYNMVTKPSLNKGTRKQNPYFTGMEDQMTGKFDCAILGKSAGRTGR